MNSEKIIKKGNQIQAVSSFQIEEIPLRDYQKRCSKKIIEMRNTSLSNITAVMPSGSGISFVMKDVIEQYLSGDSGRKIMLMVPNHEVLHGIKETLSGVLSSLDIDVLCDYEKKVDFDYDLIVFYNLTDVKDWSKIDEYSIQGRETISFIISDDPYVHHLREEIDTFESSSFEISYRDQLGNDIYKKVAYYVYSCDSCHSLRDSLYRYELQQEEENFRKLLIKESNSKADAGNTDVMAMGSDYQLFCENLLSAKGCSVEKLRSAFIKLKGCQSELDIIEETGDEEGYDDKKELLMKRIQDTISTTYAQLLNADGEMGQKEKYINKLKTALTNEAYNKLQTISRSFLVTAMMLFDNISKNERRDDWDYSPICLEITKAVEIEITKRFFTDYISFCESTHTPKPGCLFEDKDGKKRQITESEFTLGKVACIVGYKIEKIGNNRVLKQSNPTNCNNFIRYAKLKLYSDKQKAAGFVKTDLQIIDTIRTDYRNPSAHKDSMTYVNAKDCLDYVIDVQKKLKEMLTHMNY